MRASGSSHANAVSISAHVARNGKTNTITRHAGHGRKTGEIAISLGGQGSIGGTSGRQHKKTEPKIRVGPAILPCQRARATAGLGFA